MSTVSVHTPFRGEVPSAKIDHQEAGGVSCDGGLLIVTDRGNRIIGVYAPDAWLRVEVAVDPESESGVDPELLAVDLEQAKDLLREVALASGSLIAEARSRGLESTASLQNYVEEVHAFLAS